MKGFSTFFVIVLIATAFYSVNGQFSENFDDGDFLQAPTWTGDTDAFVVENGALRLVAADDLGGAMMVTESRVALDAVWSFELQMDFNPSVQNYADVYLISDTKDLHVPLNGYFVRIGHYYDAVSLYRQEGDKSSAVKIISGEENRTDVPRVNLRIRVTRDRNGNWELFSDPGQTGNFIPEGAARDNTFSGSRYFGIYCRFTSTRSDKFHFDNLMADGESAADVVSPSADSIALISGNTLKVFFSEPVTKFPCGTPSNYRIEQAGNVLAGATSVQPDGRSALIGFDRDFENETLYQLCIDRLVDSSLNVAPRQCISFTFHPPQQAEYRDVVINELMADPYPQEGLPNAEYVELYNRSDHPVDLVNWHLDGAGDSPLPNYILPPDGFVIITGSSATGLFAVPALSWGNSGSLLNAGEKLFLRDASGRAVDSLQYDDSWYRDTQKKAGGWSLELINPLSDCSGPDNWTASTDAAGGTPGRINSVFELVLDLKPPVLTGLDVLDSITLLLTFSEWPAHFSDASCMLRENPGAAGITPGPDYNQLEVFFGTPFVDGQTYNLILSGISDCAGNEMDTVTRAFKYDTQPPHITSVIPLTRNKMRITFNEKIDRKSATHSAGYVISPSAGQPLDIETANDSSVYLIFAEELQDGTYTLTYGGITDLYDNTIAAGSFRFDFLLPRPPDFNEVVISEIMADPEPVQGQPPYEYIELHNVSGRRTGLVDALLQVGQKQRTISELLLEPGEYAVLCSPSAVPHFDKTTHIVGLSNWPSLKNRGDTILLFRNDGSLVFAMAYDESFYQNTDKQSGGWSLEMIDVTRGCAGKDNWIACEDPAGGTPGRGNSNQWLKPDYKGPELIDAVAPDSATVILQFSERLHPREMDYFGAFIAPPLDIAEKVMVTPLDCRVRLRLNDPIQPGVTYTVKTDHAVDCSGNLNPETGREATFVLPELPAEGDIVINEILFHPRAGGVEFVELYNLSEKYINLQHLTLAVEKDGRYLRKKKISNNVQIFEPGEFLVLTKDPFVLKGDYPMGNMNAFHQMPLPQLSNEEGVLVLYRNDGEIIDKVHYSEDLHHPLIANPAGVSLERITFDSPGSGEVIWHSAASNAGYATPGKMNSQFAQEGVPADQITITPRVIAPGSPGISDFAEIHFSFTGPGMMATIGIYDIRGNKIKSIAKNELLPVDGSYLWYGDDDSGRGVQTGQYIVRIELYNIAGHTSVIKKTITVGRNF